MRFSMLYSGEQILSCLVFYAGDSLIKEKLIDLIEWTFQREGVHLTLPVTKDRLSSLLETQNDINFGRVKTCVMP